jgi:hypothetical protein
MDLVTLLSARRELDRGAPPLADVAAAERALLEAYTAPPGAAWIADAVRVLSEHQRQGRGERVWPVLRLLEAALRGLEPALAGQVLAAIASQALLEADAEAFLDRAGRAAEALDRGGAAGAASIERAALGGGLLALGADELAEAALDAAIVAADEAGLSIVAAAARLDRAHLDLRRGAATEAAARARAAAEGAAAVGQRRLEGLARAALASAEAALGHAEPAEAAARTAADLLQDAPESALAEVAWVRVRLCAGRPDDAVEAAARAVQAAPGWLLGGAAPAWLALADARAAAGDAVGAAAALAQAKRAVLAFASRLRSATLRRGYLEGIPGHRRALALDPA